MSGFLWWGPMAECHSRHSYFAGAKSWPWMLLPQRFFGVLSLFHPSLLQIVWKCMYGMCRFEHYFCVLVWQKWSFEVKLYYLSFQFIVCFCGCVRLWWLEYVTLAFVVQSFSVSWLQQFLTFSLWYLTLKDFRIWNTHKKYPYKSILYSYI